MSDGGDKSDLRRALGHYARTTTGGSDVGPRRFGNVYSAGGNFYAALQGLADGSGVPGLDATQFLGRSTDFFAQAIGQFLSGESADADRINRAVQEAVASVFDINADFDPADLTDETIEQLMTEFLSQSIFQTIVEDAGGAWDRAPDEEKTAECEGQLLDLIKVVVEQSFQKQMSSGGQNFTQAQIKQFMRDTTRSVWQQWESYE
ncbi:hypothetical protein [Rhizobium leguminosarum]|uniref:Uncharacterized protein n=1 Tax=Rhizobium leguminosarum TaxID=384 RepID=A0A1B1C8C2_RHILE|nr:hypothetical protein [Rhizobium leguminosarum]ANP86042.1 hypothetical protein BA011_10090 [Rhizobium leguminosarum]